MSLRRLSTEKPPFGHGSQRGVPNREEAEAIAVQAIAHIAADAGRLGRFLALTGLEPHELPHKDRWLIEESLRYIRSTGVA